MELTPGKVAVGGGILLFGIYELFFAKKAKAAEPTPPKDDGGGGGGGGTTTTTSECLNSDVAALGETVSSIQTRLHNLGYGVTVDGKCGPQTHGAISSFQKSNGIVASGTVDLPTLAKMKDKLAAPPKGAEGAKDEADGTSDGSADAMATMNGTGTWYPGDVKPAVHTHYQDGRGAAYGKAYRDAFTYTLTASNFSVTEDGDVTYNGGFGDSTTSVIGDTL